ncbi:MAG: transporter substrate-binding domain-containing protein [Oleiphilaceae bacterium]|nr:transporter substrate-binding domain-containing protein [Oleiphilaceae bacterium]
MTSCICLWHRTFHVLGLCALLATSLQTHARQKVLIGFDRDYPPYAYIDEHGDAQGIYTEILTRAFERIEGYEVQVEGYPWKRLMKMVEQGKILAAYPPYYWPARRPWMQPYSVPIITERVALYCNREQVSGLHKAGALRWPDSYFGYLIGNDAGFETPGPDFFDALEQGNIRMHEDSTLRNVQLLLLGRIDCYVNGELSILTSLRSFATDPELNQHIAKVYRAMIIRENEGFVGYSLNGSDFPYKADFVEKLDQVLLDMQKNGEIQKVLAPYHQVLIH